MTSVMGWTSIFPATRGIKSLQNEFCGAKTWVVWGEISPDTTSAAWSMVKPGAAGNKWIFEGAAKEAISFR